MKQYAVLRCIAPYIDSLSYVYQPKLGFPFFLCGKGEMPLAESPFKMPILGFLCLLYTSPSPRDEYHQSAIVKAYGKQAPVLV